MTASLFVDSNILIYAHERTARAERARECMEGLSRRASVVISPQVIAEVFVNVARLVGEEEADTYCRELIETCLVQPLDAETSAAALRIRSKASVSFWDAQVIAAAAAAGARFVLTEDCQDGQTIDGVTIVNPFREGFDVLRLDA